MADKPVVELPPVEQIGIVVKNVDEAVDYYTRTFGWGPFKVREVKVDGFIYKGKKGTCRLKMAFANSGPIEIELIQVMEGETPHTDFLREKGEGLQHLRFRVNDLDDMLAKLATEGIKPVFHRSSPEVSYAYLDTDKIGGVVFELIEVKTSLPI